MSRCMQGQAGRDKGSKSKESVRLTNHTKTGKHKEQTHEIHPTIDKQQEKHNYNRYYKIYFKDEENTLYVSYS